MRELPSGTVTFLFTDIEGSTRLLHEHGARYTELLLKHRRALREAFDRHGGVEVDTEGDAFFVVFPSAPEAVVAAAKAQAALEGGPIRVRMGLHTGQAEVVEGTYVGMDVHRAARIAAAGHGGQVVLSRATRELVDVDLRDLGEHRLKDLLAPERLYQLGPGDFPPLKSLYRTNLPIPATPFLGRERELGEVSALLAGGEVRLLTLTGAGGTGKTRLALQAAAEASEAFPDGVFWVGLAPVRDPALVLLSIAQVLETQDELASHIGSKRMLLLLDNLEQLVDIAPDLAALLSACPRLVLLVTSREPLHVSAEREYEVLPLQHADAIALFRQRARAVGTEVTSNGDVGEICRRLDHLPLAVELAAARVRVLSPPALLQRLEQRLPLLTGGARDAPERQRTLRATIEWSYDLLPRDEQELFRRLAIFRGGWTLEAAEEVCEASLDTLESLVEKSLVRHAGERFFMLETIREYAAESLAESGQGDDVARRHYEFFAALIETADPALRNGPDPMWLSRLDADHQNLRAALEWAQAGGDGDAALRLVIGIQYFWWLRGQIREAKRWHDLVLEHARDPTPSRGKALVGAARFAFMLKDHERAEACGREALELWREIGDVDWTIRALNELGNVLSDSGGLAEGVARYQEALALARAHGDVRWAIVLTSNIADALLQEGRYEEARSHYEEGLREAQAVDFLSGKTNALVGLGQVELGLGREEAAATALEEALRHVRTIGHRELASYCFRGLAVLAAWRRDARRAARLGALADALEESLGMSSPFRPDLDAAARAFARDALGDYAYARTCEEARAMEFEEAVAYGLASIESLDRHGGDTADVGADTDKAQETA